MLMNVESRICYTHKYAMLFRSLKFKKKISHSTSRNTLKILTTINLLGFFYSGMDISWPHKLPNIIISFMDAQ